MERAGASAPIETESEPRSFVETRADVRNGSILLKKSVNNSR
jgi:hypothetical protein